MTLTYTAPGRYEEAFGAALHRGDLGTVVWLCRQVDAAAVFANDEPALSQSILLSLMQQLNSDLAQARARPAPRRPARPRSRSTLS